MTLRSWEGWLPIGIDWKSEKPTLTWFARGGAEFTDPYFSQTITRYAQRPFNMAFCRQTPLEALDEAAAALPRARELSGIVFHTSRCGSTLVSRAFQDVRGALVIAEAPPVDALARARLRRAEIRPEQQIQWLRALIHILGATRTEPGPYVLKVDAWNALDIALFERAFPDVPWVFVYRDPVEVLVSHLMRASYMMSAANSADFLGIALTEAVHIPRDEYCARVLGRILCAVREHGVKPEALVNYHELPQAVWSRIAPQFSIALTATDLESISRGVAFNAKMPGVYFSDDRPMKQQLADARMREVAARWMQGPFAHLESLRVSAGISASKA